MKNNNHEAYLRKVFLSSVFTETNVGQVAVVAHAFNASTWEAEAGRSLCSSQPGLQSEFQDSQRYTENPCLEKNSAVISEKVENINN